MGMTDPISDLLTRMRNAIAMSKDTVLVPASNMKLRIVYLLKEEGFIKKDKMVDYEPLKSEAQMIASTQLPMSQIAAFKEQENLLELHDK